MADNFQWSNRSATPRTKKPLVIFGFLFILILGVPIAVFMSQTQQHFQQSAHTPQPSVAVSCGVSSIILTATYTISNVPNNVTCQVVATDSQNYLNDNFSMKNGDPAHIKTADTETLTLKAGVVTYKTTCSDGFTETDQVGYKQTKQCTVPSLTPSPTPSLTPTITPPACTTNQSTCQWKASTGASTYHYKVTDITSGSLTEGDTTQTFVSFPSIAGHSYTCTITPTNECGAGNSGTFTFTCSIPTPTACPAPSTPTNVRISCPTCSQ